MSANKRITLTASQRRLVKAKTAGRCHICGGPAGRKWTADHVIPHLRGGSNAVNNFLAACTICNRLRWKYSPKQIRQILEIGVYAQAEIRRSTKLGQELQALQRGRQRQKKVRRRSGS